MDTMVSKHLVQQTQFATAIQNTKLVTNAINVIPHPVNPQIINHSTINNQNTNIKTNASATPEVSADHSQPAQVMSIARLNELVREIDPTLQLDEEVEEVLMDMADTFLDQVIQGSCKMAKHRHLPVIEIKDVQLYLEQAFNLWVPGFGTNELKPYKRAPLAEAHKQRLALIRRAMKKY